MDKVTFRSYVRGAYDVQKFRIACGLRIVNNWKVRHGQAPGEKEKELDAKGQAILRDIRSEYRTISERLADLPSRRKFDKLKERDRGIISDYTELILIAHFTDLYRSEKAHFKHLGSLLCAFPIWTEFLEGVKGIGPAMAGVIISEIDIAQDFYASSVHKYAGLDVAPDGRGRRMYKEHLIDREYTNKDGTVEVRKSITYNPFLKSKLLGVLAGSFLKQGNEPYAGIYYNYRNRLESSDKYGVHLLNDKGKPLVSKGHRHAMAQRYMIKRFLIDLYVKWRTLEGLPVAPEYAVAKLGIIHRPYAEERRVQATGSE